jgi:hypothetical protein
MAKLKTIYFRNLPLAAHCRFCIKVSNEITNSPSALIQTLGQLPTQFNTCLTVEKAIEDWIVRSFLTEQIEEADRQMDRALTALRAQVRAQEYSSTTTVAAAAKRVYIMLMDYGKVTVKPYEKQAGDVQSILRQFASGGPYYYDAATLGLSTLISELQAALTLFDQLLKQRDEKSLLKPDKTSAEIRSEIEPIYHRIEAKINAGAELNTSTAFETFINHLNPEIERLNEEFHRVRHDIADCQPEQIQPQTYTGRPLTPTPKVLYVTTHDGTVQLELGKDYNLTFKNNTDVGSAECTIHGKGAYKGRKTVTFVIVRTL